ncbi:glycosyltransferase family 4 protein [Novosphingobium piscinae]|uniref:Glycosyltransferase family 4 protein n=1 Tax=Novosphingobium piscinae TaxID=1507448 RepID=A0A7X1FW81_9SPHN|nr:glycosyltransferase family 4 protein [Novosphingobium piscinae]MBC2668134.1 glycosyltransferase family 4 protein [Novosphingobium piscinae]
MTRIAYLVSEYPAPSHTFIRREIAALRRRGCDIGIYSVRPAARAPQSEQERADHAETQAVLGRSPVAYLAACLAWMLTRPWRTVATLRLALRHRPPGAKALIWALFYWVEAALLARLLQRDGAQRLHSHFANNGATVGLLAASLVGIPWSMTLHGISETDYPAGLMLPAKIRHADFVACASWFMRAQAMRVSPVEHWPKLHVVRCGVEPEALAGHAAERGVGVRFVCVGRLSAEKGQHGLLEAFAAVRRQRSDVSLDLVGDGPLRADLERAARALGVADAVTFHGALPEPQTIACIGRSDILVLPSYMEGLPLVLMEAMGLGRPVVASGVAGIPELVRDGENGLLVPPGHVAALAGAMLRLADDPPLRQRLGQAAREAVHAEFVIDRAVIPLQDLLHGKAAPGEVG